MSLFKFSSCFALTVVIGVTGFMGCASHPVPVSPVRSKSVEVPFSITDRKDKLAIFPNYFWNSNYQFSSVRSADTEGALEQSGADGRIDARRLDAKHVHLKFTVDSCERSETLPGEQEKVWVAHKDAIRVFTNAALELTLNLETKQVTEKKGFEKVSRKIKKLYGGKPQEDFLLGLLSSIGDDPSGYFNFGPFSLNDLQVHVPGQHWSPAPGNSALGSSPLDQAFAGWTEKSDENFAVFTSATTATPVSLGEKSSLLAEVSGSFAVNSWLLVREDWKILHSKFQIHQSILDLNSKKEITGTSSIENTLEAL